MVGTIASFVSEVVRVTAPAAAQDVASVCSDAGGPPNGQPTVVVAEVCAPRAKAPVGSVTMGVA